MSKTGNTSQLHPEIDTCNLIPELFNSGTNGQIFTPQVKEQTPAKYLLVFVYLFGLRMLRQQVHPRVEETMSGDDDA